MPEKEFTREAWLRDEYQEWLSAMREQDSSFEINTIIAPGSRPGTILVQYQEARPIGTTALPHEEPVQRPNAEKWTPNSRTSPEEGGIP